MNWTKISRLFASALFAAALIAFAAAGSAQDTGTLGKDGLLTIDAEEEVDLTESALTSLANGQESPDEENDPVGLLKIHIEKDGTLSIKENTTVTVDGNAISVEGTLSIINNTDTKLQGKLNDEDEPTTIALDLDGGTLQITDGSNTDAFDLNANIGLGTSGGTIEIAEENTLKIAAITGNETGILVIKGGGTLQVTGSEANGAIAVKDAMELAENTTLEIFNGAQIGKLTVAAGSVIDGLRGGEDENSKLIITGEDSVINGTLKNIGMLVVGGGTAADLTINGGTHDVESLAVNSGAVLDVTEGTKIQLTKEQPTGENEKTYDDMTILGTLKVSSAAGTGIGKANDDDTYITISGSTDSDGKVVNGIIEVYASDTDPEIPETVDAGKIHTQILGIGKISVGEGVTFTSGGVGFGKGTDGKQTGGYLYVDGGGHYQANSVNLGTGNLYVQEKGTAMNVLGTITANGLSTEAETTITAGGDAEFSVVELAGHYAGGSHNLTISKGGHITGQISGVDTFKAGGSLFLQVNDDGATTIEADHWDIDENTYIRTVGGTKSGDYSKVLKIADETERANLLEILTNSQTALYRPGWAENTEDSSYLDLQLAVLGIHDYTYSIWNQRGDNPMNAALLLEYLCNEFPSFREGLESLNDAQLQSTLRSVMVGELAGNAVRAALQQPAQSVFRHLDTVVPLRFPFSNVRGQVREGFNVWFNPYGQSEHADSDGNTFDGYTMTRFGFHLGGDIELYNRALLGAFFGYANPQVKSGLGKITADDYTAGMYLRVPTAWAVVANFMVGFGNQSYNYDNPYYDTAYRGSSVFASAELTRPISFHSYRLTPLIAVDYQSANVDNFLSLDPILGAVVVRPEDISQVSMRFGLLGNFGRFRTRLQYTRQVAGDDVAATQTSVWGALSAATLVKSTEWGKDWLNVGIGGELLQTRHWRLFADYNFDVGKQTASHQGSLNAVLKW